MKRVLLVVETLKNIRIIAYDYGKTEPVELIIDLEKEFDPEARIKDIIQELELKGYDTRVLKRFLEKRGKYLRRGPVRHG